MIFFLSMEFSSLIILKGKDVVILWGSQSGTAEAMASRLARDLKGRFGLDCLVADLSDYDPESIANIPEAKIAIFLVSTYGDGDPSDNATPLMAWLGTNSRVNFEKLRYAAFGLGNKNYKHYNKVVDELVAALDKMGSIALLATGKADDSNGGTEEDYSTWKQALYTMFATTLGYKVLPSRYTPALCVREDTSLDLIDLHSGEPVPIISSKKTSMPISTIHALPLKSSKKLLSTQFRNCLHVDLDLREFVGLKYNTGDHVAVWPSNPKPEIERLVAALGLEAKRAVPLLITSLDASIPTKLPSPVSLDTLLQYYLEICAPIGREMIQTLAQFAPTATAKAVLERIGHDRVAYDEFFETHPNTLGHILLQISPEETWSKVPLSYLIEILPTLSARYYSISSSSIVQPKTVSLTVATSTHNDAGRQIPGLTTNYLLDLESSARAAGGPHESQYNLNGPDNLLVNHKVFAHIRKSKFRLPVQAKHPIIMVASGSGIAPFRAFLQERIRLATMGRQVGSSLLFFGCRSSEEYLYKSEIEDMVASSNGLVQVITAFSREPAERKWYVQDRIAEVRAQVVKMLTEDDANLYLCGSARMARDVAGRLGDCLRREKDWDGNQAEAWAARMKKTHKWQEDVWS